jgi:hypothetical protein
LRYLTRRAIHSDRSTTTSLNIIKSLDRGGDNKGSKFGPSEPKKSETTHKTESCCYSLVQALLRNASSDGSQVETHVTFTGWQTFRNESHKDCRGSTLYITGGLLSSSQTRLPLKFLRPSFWIKTFRQLDHEVVEHRKVP